MLFLYIAIKSFICIYYLLFLLLSATTEGISPYFNEYVGNIKYQ